MFFHFWEKLSAGTSPGAESEDRNKKETLRDQNLLGNKKSARRDSNPRPPPWQGGAPPLSHSRLSCFSVLKIFTYPQNRIPNYLGQALDRLVQVSCTHCCAYTSCLSTSYSLRGLTSSQNGISHLGGGFTLRCLQRLSPPGLATLPWSWSPTGPPAARPSRSSRTKDGSPQISCARAG